MLKLLQNELIYYFKNKIEYIEIISFITIIQVIISLASPSTSKVSFELLTLGFWLAVALTAATGAARLFERDAQNGILELYQLAPISLELLVLGKWLGFYALIALSGLVTLPIFILLQPIDWQIWALAMVSGGLSLSLIHMLASVLLMKSGRSAAFLNLLALPLIVPTLIFGSTYIRQADIWHESLIFMILYGLFLLPAVTLATASSIRASN